MRVYIYCCFILIISVFIELQKLQKVIFTCFYHKKARYEFVLFLDEFNKSLKKSFKDPKNKECHLRALVILACSHSASKESFASLENIEYIKHWEN